jgi:hypothetical protein
MGWMAPLRHRRAKLVFRRITRNGSVAPCRECTETNSPCHDDGSRVAVV